MKDVFIIGDLMVKYINGREVSDKNTVKVRSHLEQQQMTSLIIFID